MKPEEILRSLHTRGGANARSLRDAERRLGRELPQDYKSVLLESDGFEGFLGVDCYVTFWSASDLASLNDSYSVWELAPGVVLLGTNGGDTGFGYQRAGEHFEYVSVPLVGMEPGAVAVLGGSFAELLANLTE